MGKRLGVLGAAIALVALAVGVVTPALGSSGEGDDDKQRTIRVTSITTEEAFVDLGDEGDSLGDQFVASSKYVKDGEQVGHDSVVCTITSLERGEAQCVATAWFRGGQITGQALISFEGEPRPVSITGGSGKYVGAEGEVHIRPLSETKAILTFHLED
jgi:hypothetical protein